MIALLLVAQLSLQLLSLNDPCSIDTLQAHVEIHDIRAHLFYEHSGRLSEDITQMSGMVLWNAIIGEGDVAEPASHLFVAVVLKGPPECYAGTVQVRFTATGQEQGERFFDESRVVGLIGPDGEWAAPFLLTDSTCDSISLEAAIVGEAQERTEKLEFRCGE